MAVHAEPKTCGAPPRKSQLRSPTGSETSTAASSFQFTSEMFYRFQLTEFLAVTPDVQLIVNPALNPSADAIAFFGIRLRAAF